MSSNKQKLVAVLILICAFIGAVVFFAPNSIDKEKTSIAEVKEAEKKREFVKSEPLISEDVVITEETLAELEELDISEEDKNDPEFVAAFQALKASAEKSDEEGLRPDEITQEQLELALKLTDDPDTIALLQSSRTKTLYSEFLSGKPIPQDKKREMALELTERLDLNGNTDYITPYETLIGRMAVIQVLEDDKIFQQDLMTRLAEEMKVFSENNPDVDLAAAQGDPDAEMAIVQEVLAMDSFPEGMTQQEYLDQRIDEFRRGQIPQ